MPSAYAPPNRIDDRILNRSLARTRRAVFWLDDGAPAPEPSLRGRHHADLVVVGGGYTGLWTALLAKQREPSARVVLLEAQQIAWAASGRNGGFCEASLTHGDENGRLHFAQDLPLLNRLGAENLDAIERTVTGWSFDTEFERTGMLQVATEEHQLDGLRKLASAENETYLDAEAVQQQVKSPLYRGGVHLSDTVAMVHPAKLAWGLRAACLEAGVLIAENTAATDLTRDGTDIIVSTPNGSVKTRKVALATSAFPSLLKRADLFVVPVYDYVLMTEPLTSSHIADIGWHQRYGIADSSRQFHYYRLTADNRILFGGYDAVYHRGGAIRSEHDDRPVTFRKLADHFFRTFPQLTDVDFTHAWGGAIDMSTKLVAHTGSAFRGQVAYTAGYTGLGVGATRFGATVMLDVLSGDKTELTELAMVKTKPFPIPPEPIAYPAIQLTRAAVARSDERNGRDGPLLKLMGALHIGFDT
ncbi:MAG: FAD-binding oxidoreductase [Microbacterium sp.]